MLVDANLLLYAFNRADPRHDDAASWLGDALNGPTNVGLPWQSLTAFVRIATNTRLFPRPLSPDAASEQVARWLAAPAVWVPTPTERHAEVFLGLVRRYRIVGPLVMDAHLAALAIEHGIEVASTDADFARFREVRWVDPLTPKV
jgi:toxin-antitoxin system PIN domain toxin